MAIPLSARQNFGRRTLLNTKSCTDGSTFAHRVEVTQHLHRTQCGAVQVRRKERKGVNSFLCALTCAGVRRKCRVYRFSKKLTRTRSHDAAFGDFRCFDQKTPYMVVVNLWLSSYDFRGMCGLKRLGRLLQACPTLSPTDKVTCKPTTAGKTSDVYLILLNT